MAASIRLQPLQSRLTPPPWCPNVLFAISALTLTVDQQCKHTSPKLYRAVARFFYKFTGFFGRWPNQFSSHSSFHCFEASGLRKWDSCHSASLSIDFSPYYTPPRDWFTQLRSTITPRPPVPERIAYRLAVLAFCCQHGTTPICQAHSCGWHRFSMASSIIKHGGACNSTIEALNDWWSCVSSRGGTCLEQFATFRLIVSIAASIQAEIEDRFLHTLVPATEYWTSISRVKLAHIIDFYFVKWPWSSLKLYILVNFTRL